MKESLSFLNPEELRRALGFVMIDAEAMNHVDATALACLFNARMLMGGRYGRAPEDAERAANLIEFASGADWQTVRAQIDATGATPEGAARLLRMLTDQAHGLIDQEPQALPMAQIHKDAEVLSTDEPQTAAHELYHMMRESGMTALSAAGTMTVAGVRAALRDGASRWQIARLLIELLDDVAAGIPIGPTAAR